MKTIKRLINLSLFLLLSTILSAQTADAFKPVKAKLVPTEVLNSFEDLTKAKVMEWRYDNRTYEAKVSSDEEVFYYRFNPVGLYLEKRALLDWEQDAKENLKETLSKTYHKNAEIVEFYEATEADGEVYYILQLREKSNNRLKTIYLDKNGGLREKAKSGY